MQFPGICNGAADLIDYDMDGDLDIFLTGASETSSYASLFYRNDGNGLFVPVDLGLTGFAFNTMAWGDYDNDQDPDLLLVGEIDSRSAASHIYRNDGNSTFKLIDTDITSLSESAAAWGDFDNDGDLDVLVCGKDSRGIYTSQLYVNEGADAFADADAGLAGVGNGHVLWADYDQDGDLDIFLSGEPGYSILYDNQVSVVNSVPLPPNNLTVSSEEDAVIFKWNMGNDVETPALGLTYNLRIGTVSGGTDILFPMAHDNGQRLIAHAGSVIGTNYHLVLAPGRYFWSVQAVDTGFAGSHFAEEQVFELGYLCHGDMDGDGDVDGGDVEAFAVAYDAALATADMNGDNEITTEDLRLFARDVGMESCLSGFQN